MDTFSKILKYTDMGMAGLNILLFPPTEIADMAEQDLGFISHASTGLTITGGLTSLLSFIHNREAHWTIKWIVIPLIILHVAALAVLFGVAGAGSFGKFKELAKKGMSLISPGLTTLTGGYLIYEMMSEPEENMTVANFGGVIYKLPAIMAYTPLKQTPYYAIVILIRSGGLVTQSVGGFIEILEAGNAEQKKLAAEMKEES